MQGFGGINHNFKKKRNEKAVLQRAVFFVIRLPLLGGIVNIKTRRSMKVFYLSTGNIIGASLSAHRLYSSPEGCNPSVASSEGLVLASLVEGVISR